MFVNIIRMVDITCNRVKKHCFIVKIKIVMYIVKSLLYIYIYIVISILTTKNTEFQREMGEKIK